MLRRYRNNRLPGSYYFQLSEKELLDCKRQFGLKSKIPKSLSEEFLITLTASIFIFILASLFSFYIRLGILMNFVIALSLSSLPMWLLFFLGNFGGYNSNDLRLFSCLYNRVRALLMASLFSFIAYQLTSKFLI